MGKISLGRKLAVSVLAIAGCLMVLQRANALSGRATRTNRPQNASPTIFALETQIQRLMTDGDVPGLAIGLIRNNKLVWAHGFGVKNAETREPVIPATIFEAASLSKPVIAYAVLKLVDEGKIGLDVPLSKYLPNYISGDDRINLITTRMVLSHRTGFPNWRRNGGDLKILFTPGEKFSYSGEGFVYLGRVVERITGQKLNDVITQEVFEPLGMTSSSYVWRIDYDQLSAVGHDEAGSPRPKYKPREPNPAGSLHTNVLDYSRFLIAVMKGVGLKPETSAQMLTVQVRVDPQCTNCAAIKPGVLSDSLGWGLGVGLEHTEFGDAFWHWGDNGVFKCYFQAYPKQGAGIVVFTNSENGLSIVPDIVSEAFKGPHPIFAWLKYDRYDSPAHRFLKEALAGHTDEAIKEYTASAAKDPKVAIDEDRMNSIGYALLRQKRVDEAVSVFKLNASAHPESWNAYDSLAEAYMTEGDKELAIKNYQKSIELNPGNQNGVAMLKKLEGK